MTRWALAALAALAAAASLGCTAPPATPRFGEHHPASVDAAESPLPERSPTLSMPAGASRDSMAETP